MFKKIILANIFSFLFFISLSQRATFDKQKITVGDRVKLHLEIPANAGNEIKFPDFGNELVNGLEIINISDIKKDKTNKYLMRDIILTAFTDSLFLIKGIPFIVDGDTLLTNPLRLKVSYFKPDSAFMSNIDTTQMLKTADIKPPVRTPLTVKEFMQRFGIYIIIVLIILLLTYIIILRYIKNKKNKNTSSPEKQIPEIPPHIKAIRRINDLRNKGLHKQDNPKPFYTELSNIIRKYIEERFNIPALESTTSEIIDSFNKTEYSAEASKNKLTELLSLADTVKFAKNKPGEHENEIMTEYALSFINSTKEKEENNKTQKNTES